MSYKFSPKFTRKTKKMVDKLLNHVYSQGKKTLFLTYWEISGTTK